jgi:hypothetical protein
MKPSLGALPLLAFAVVLVTAARAADLVVIEDWARVTLGVTGIPPQWQGQTWGSPKYDLAVVENSGRRALHMKSQDEGSTISRDIKGKVNLKEHPVLEWSWRVTVLPRGANSCAKATDDQAAQIYVTWPRFPEAVRSRTIGYVWDSTVAAGTVCKSEKAVTITYVVVRSGSSELGQWRTERRNVREDFRTIYGEDPENPGVVSLAIDSNDTHSTAESFVGAILFRRP